MAISTYTQVICIPLSFAHLLNVEEKKYYLFIRHQPFPGWLAREKYISRKS